MTTISNQNIKNIKSMMKDMREALKVLEIAEQNQEKSRNVRQYEDAKTMAQNSYYDIFQAIEGMLKEAEVIGINHDAINVRDYMVIETHTI